ncbi:MAG: hypothetical protein LBR79_02210 [Oscillospiraceae bacterium]|jgi:hypothetical protein|nr:hypothetical protein [Oscillospiraceae bacterium]
MSLISIIQYRQIILNYTAEVQNLNESVELRNCTLEHFLKPLNKAVKEAKGIEKDTHRKINWDKVKKQRWRWSLCAQELIEQCPKLEKVFCRYFDIKGMMYYILPCTQLNEKKAADKDRNVELSERKLKNVFKGYPNTIKSLKGGELVTKLKPDVESLKQKRYSQRVQSIISIAERIVGICKENISGLQREADFWFMDSKKTKERAKIVKSSQTLTLIQAAKKKTNKKNTTAVLNQLKKNHKTMLGAAVDKTLKVLDTKEF